MNDVCLIVEGSYPYVTGGVSEWVDGLVRGLPELEFSVVHLRGEEQRAARYSPPANVERIVDVVVDPERDLCPADPSPVPDARVYHALATGSAGVLGVAASRAHGRPLLLSEHGLAWREAPMGSPKCIQGAADPVRTREELERYVEAIEASARSAYAHATAITSVCGANARLQRTQGASPAKQLVFPNAVASVGETIRSGPSRVGFVGRVAPIKDVETFLHACRLVADESPATEFVVVGPLDQDRDYAERCIELARSLALDVQFTGDTDPAQWYAQLDALVLTSLSEAQPLVLLEAMAHGVPVVATDVGGCAQLVAGAGLVTPVRAPRATADAVLRLLGDELLHRRLGRAGRTRVAAAHRPEQLQAAFRSLYERVAA